MIVLQRWSTRYIVTTLVALYAGLLSAEKTIYIMPGAWGQLFAVHDQRFNSDGQREPMYRLRQEFESLGYSVKQADSINGLADVKYLVSFDIPTQSIKGLQAYPYEKRVCFLWEPPSVKPYNYDKNYHVHFSRIFTWNDELVDNQKYFKFFYPQPSLAFIEEPVPFDQKRFCTLIARNRRSSYKDEIYSKRVEMISFFQRLGVHDFDLYGHGWKGYSSYKGSVACKKDVLKKYRFCICYENTYNISGYVTEKIFDCLVAGCVPVYWGANNVTDYVPQECFIDRRDFKSNQELYDYLRSITQEEYEAYIAAIKAYLASDDAYLYSTECFIEIMKTALLGEE